MRVVSWNIDRPGEARMQQRVADLRTLSPDLALLQEVSEANAERLVADFGSDQVAAGVFLRGRGADETTSRDRGCAIVCQGSARPVGSPTLLEGHVAPERSLIRQIAVDHEEFYAASFHQIAGSDRKWGRPAKRAVFEAIAQWAAEHERRCLFGIDANSPETDHPDVAQNRYFPVDGSFDQREYLLHDPRHAPHVLEDVYRRFLREHAPEQLESIRGERPSGPLAISHVNRGRPRRFDFIFASPDLQLSHVEYREDLRRGANEHAPIVATVELH